jgi:AraC-like DNA-binding protein
LYIRDVAAGAAREYVEAWVPRVPGIAEVLHARFVEHRYPPHTHDTWAVIIVDRGAIRYDLARHHRGADWGTVTVLPPHVTHDGRAATDVGFRKRVVYLDTTLVPAALVGRSVDRSEITDPRLRHEIAGLHDSLRAGEEALDAEGRVAQVVTRLRTQLGDRTDPPAPDFRLAHQLRDFLTAHADGPVTLTDASRVLQRSVGHLTRDFTATFAISPHAYVIGRRIDRARHLLLAGQPAAQVAIEVGFFDQAHFTRHFRKHTSTTPGRFARSGARQ